MAKNTYGTGCFTLMNTGSHSIRCDSGLLTSVAWSIGRKVTYAWRAARLTPVLPFNGCGTNAASLPPLTMWIFWPSPSPTTAVFTSSRPYGPWRPLLDSYARGSFFGLTRGSGKAELCRAVLEGIAFEVADLVQTMNEAAASIHF